MHNKISVKQEPYLLSSRTGLLTAKTDNTKGNIRVQFYFKKVYIRLALVMTWTNIRLIQSPWNIILKAQNRTCIRGVEANSLAIVQGAL